MFNLSLISPTLFECGKKFGAETGLLEIAQKTNSRKKVAQTNVQKADIEQLIKNEIFFVEIEKKTDVEEESGGSQVRTRPFFVRI